MGETDESSTTRWSVSTTMRTMKSMIRASDTCATELPAEFRDQDERI